MTFSRRARFPAGLENQTNTVKPRGDPADPLAMDSSPSNTANQSGALVSDRRKEARFTIGASAVLRRHQAAEAYPAVTVDIAPTGVRFRLSDVNPFSSGDAILCEISLPDCPDQAFAVWGVGRVVWVDQLEVALDLETGVFQPPTDSM